MQSSRVLRLRKRLLVLSHWIGRYHWVQMIHCGYLGYKCIRCIFAVKAEKNCGVLRRKLEGTEPTHVALSSHGTVTLCGKWPLLPFFIAIRGINCSISIYNLNINNCEERRVLIVYIVGRSERERERLRRKKATTQLHFKQLHKDNRHHLRWDRHLKWLQLLPRYE